MDGEKAYYYKEEEAHMCNRDGDGSVLMQGMTEIL